jgi:hypothetical protein
MGADTLNGLVSSAIWHAEQLDDLGLEIAPLAWAEVSKLEEELAKEMPAEGAEGRIARRGAVAAALKANDVARAEDLASQYSRDAGSEALRKELSDLLRAAADGLSEQFPHAAKRHRPNDLLRLARLLMEHGPFLLAT